MKTTDVLSLLDDAVKKTAEANVKTIELSALKAYVTQLRAWHAEDEKGGAHEQSVEQYRTHVTLWVEDQKREHEWGVEMFRSVIEAGQSAVKSIILINGGAAVALLAFAGHVVSQPAPAIPVQPIAYSMAAFVVGVFAGGLTSGMRYMAQFCYGGDWDKTGTVFNVVAVVSGLASLGFFCWGGYLAYSAIVGP